MVDLMSLLSDALIGSFQMFMLNDFGKNMFPCHDMMLDPDWRNIADLIFKFIEKTIDKKSGDNYNDNYVSTQAHQGGE